jgi:hypothetical protein
MLDRISFAAIAFAAALGALYKQILHLCEAAGLVRLGHVALDGTKIKANASKHKAISYELMEKRAAELQAEVAKWRWPRGKPGLERDRASALPQFIYRSSTRCRSGTH